MIVIIDYGTANLKSVANALSLLGAEVIISNKKEDLVNADKIILPGVGSFAEGMKNLHQLNLVDILYQEVILNKKPLLGICLGMHLLGTTGFEGGVTKGLNFIPGETKKLVLNDLLKVPHMGWDNIVLSKPNPLIVNNNNFYFVHSFHFVPSDPEVVLATCDYGLNIVAAIKKDNIFATQFHPEKSQQHGLKILENFLEWENNA